MTGAYENSNQPPLIHIGYPRALSTWLQSQFFLPENGFNVIMGPLRAGKLIVNHHCFNFDESRVKNFIKNKCQGTDIPVITCEVLSGNPFHGGYNGKLIADRLKKIFPKAKILLIIREQKALIRSHYALRILFGSTQSIDSFLKPSNIMNPPSKFVYDYFKFHLIAEYYTLLYGKENVLILPYEQFKFEPNVFIKKINEFIGNSLFTEDKLTHLPFYEKINPMKLTGLKIELRRIWNIIKQNRLFLSHNPIYSGIIEAPVKPRAAVLDNHLKRLDNYLPSLFEDKFEKQLKRKIEMYAAGKFAESNRKLESLLESNFSQYGYET